MTHTVQHPFKFGGKRRKRVKFNGFAILGALSPGMSLSLTEPTNFDGILIAGDDESWEVITVPKNSFSLDWKPIRLM